MKQKDPFKLTDDVSKGFGQPKDAREPFDLEGAEEHFKKTGQASVDLFGTSNRGQRKDAPEPQPDPFPGDNPGNEE